MTQSFVGHGNRTTLGWQCPTHYHASSVYCQVQCWVPLYSRSLVYMPMSTAYCVPLVAYCCFSALLGCTKIRNFLNHNTFIKYAYRCHDSQYNTRSFSVADLGPVCNVWHQIVAGVGTWGQCRRVPKPASMSSVSAQFLHRICLYNAVVMECFSDLCWLSSTTFS